MYLHSYLCEHVYYYHTHIHTHKEKVGVFLFVFLRSIIKFRTGLHVCEGGKGKKSRSLVSVLHVDTLYVWVET